jgi:hypothetical protein
VASFPGRITSYDLALFPDGSMVEAAADATGAAYARWLSDGTWGPWFLVGARILLVSVTAAVSAAGSVNTAYVAAVTSGPGNVRGIYSLTASGTGATAL